MAGRLLILLLAAVAAATPASAEVELAFYSRDGDGRTFPHAFVALTGSGGPRHEPIDRAVGFTARRVSMDIVAVPVAGALMAEPPAMIARSRRHLAIRLSDRRYQAVREAIRRWRSAPQPNYHLERRNCVHFVADVARAAGLAVPAPGLRWRDPQAYVAALAAANRGRPRLSLKAM